LRFARGGLRFARDGLRFAREGCASRRTGCAGGPPRGRVAAWARSRGGALGGAGGAAVRKVLTDVVKKKEVLNLLDQVSRESRNINGPKEWPWRECIRNPSADPGKAGGN
jgi:hypothetical protein